MSLSPLRPYQQDCLDQARAHIQAGKNRILIVQPTGCGKTRTAVEACLGHVKLGGVPMFVAPRRELVSQATRALEAAGLWPGHDVFVRTIQELTGKGATIPPATMVVLDEARHYVADEWGQLAKALPNALYLGLDATPERGDGKGLGGLFDVLVEAISVREAIAQGYLVPCEVLRPAEPLGPRELAQDPFDIYFAKAEGTSAVVFCHSVTAARELSARFCARGVWAAAVWGDMPVAERDDALDRFADGRLKVLTNMHLLTEGWDAPITETIILARGFPTAGGLLQAAGRGLRPHPGKTRCLLIDLSGCTHLHGEPDEPRTWHLEGRAARRAADGENARFCPICGGVVLTAECEACGYAGAEMKKRKPRILGLPCERFARQREMPEEKQVAALASYMRVARMKGYREGWALKCWSHKFGREATPEMKRTARGMT